MSESYTGTGAIGTVTSGDRKVTFIADAFTTTPTVIPSLTAPAETATTSNNRDCSTAADRIRRRPQPRSPVKTTFTPLPAWITVAGLGIAAIALLAGRKY